VAAEIVGKKGVRELCRNVGGNMANQTGKRGGGEVGMSQWKYFARSALSSGKCVWRDVIGVHVNVPYHNVLWGRMKIGLCMSS